METTLEKVTELAEELEAFAWCVEGPEDPRYAELPQRTISVLVTIEQALAPVIERAEVALMSGEDLPDDVQDTLDVGSYVVVDLLRSLASHGEGTGGASFVSDYAQHSCAASMLTELYGTPRRLEGLQRGWWGYVEPPLKWHGQKGGV